MLRIDLNLLWTVINILILYFLVRRFLLKPIAKIIDQRQQQVEQRFAEADAAQRQALDTQKKYDDSLAALAQEKEQQLAEARKNATGEYQRILAEANDKAELLLTDARTTAEDEKTKIINGAKGEITEMVATAAAKVAAVKTDPAADSALYDQFLQKVGESSDASGK